ncbi:hypothetical protein ABPG77_005868 [Micractinium sp. CCAP 211/92]
MRPEEAAATERRRERPYGPPQPQPQPQQRKERGQGQEQEQSTWRAAKAPAPAPAQPQLQLKLAQQRTRPAQASVQRKLEQNLLFVRGLSECIEPGKLAGDLQALAEQAGGRVLRCFIEPGKHRGHDGHLELATARQAAMVLERLQHFKLHDHYLFCRPDLQQLAAAA